MIKINVSLGNEHFCGREGWFPPTFKLKKISHVFMDLYTDLRGHNHLVCN